MGFIPSFELFEGRDMFPSFDINCRSVVGRLAVNQTGKGAEIGHCILVLGLLDLSGQKRLVK